MTMPTVNNLAQTLMRECGESIDNPALVAQFESWIQDVYDMIGIQTNWRYLWTLDTLTTVSGTRLYNLNTSNIEQEIAARFTSDNTPLVKKDKQQLIEAGSNIELAGKPNIWYIESYNSSASNYNIGLWYVPNAIFEIEFISKMQPQELASITQLPFPREFIHVLKEGVRVKYREDDKNFTGAQLAQQRFEQGTTQLTKINSQVVSKHNRMQIMDISYNNYPFVKLPPDHFRN